MKSKLRKIVVDKREFKTSVSQISPNLVCLRIWLPNARSRPYAQVKYRFDDPWLHFPEMAAAKGELHQQFQIRPLTPGAVVKIIRKIVSSYGLERPLSATLNFELVDAGELQTIENALKV